MKALTRIILVFVGFCVLCSLVFLPSGTDSFGSGIVAVVLGLFGSSLIVLSLAAPGEDELADEESRQK